jgi:hypothetical protein
VSGSVIDNRGAVMVFKKLKSKGLLVLVLISEATRIRNENSNNNVYVLHLLLQPDIM